MSTPTELDRRLALARGHMEWARRIHEAWVNCLTNVPGFGEVLATREATSGTAEHHEEWMRHYDDVLAAFDTLERLQRLLVFADGLAVAETGQALADLYAEDCEWAQATLVAAGCHARCSVGPKWAHSLADDDKSCSCGWAGEDGQAHMAEVLAAMAKESS